MRTIRGNRVGLGACVTRHAFWAGLSVVFCSDGALAQAPSNVFDYTRTSAFEYHAQTGLLTAEIVEPDTPQSCVRTTHLQDGYGNRIRSTVANCAGATGRALFAARESNTNFAPAQLPTVTIDGQTFAASVGTFAINGSNAAGHAEARVFDPRTGAVRSLTGPNDLTTTWTVDEWGRKEFELRADGTRTAYLHCFIAGRISDLSSNTNGCTSLVFSSGEVPADAVQFVQFHLLNTSGAKAGAFTRTYLDRLGREIRVVTEAFDAATQTGGSDRRLAKDAVYNAFGAKVIETQLYFLNSSSSTASGSGDMGLMRTDYDALGRPLAVLTADPNGSQTAVTFGTYGSRRAARTSFTYNGLTSTATDDRGRATVQEKSPDGKVVRITNPQGAQLVHQYDAFDNLIRTKDPLGNPTRTEFDVRGRRLKLFDPNTGEWRYDYNALGELVWQESPNQRLLSQSTTMAYDRLGRMTSRVTPEFTTTWFYDAYANASVCNRGKGKLCEVTTSSGLNRRFVYDSVGRPISNRATITVGPSFASAIAYDVATGRVSSQTYPTGLRVNYAYTPKGYLRQITLGTAATVNPLPAAPGGSPGSSVSLPVGSVLWEARVMNAWGRLEQQSLGNGVVTQAAYQAASGRVIGLTAGIGGGLTVQNQGFAWDSVGNLTSRNDQIGDGGGAVSETFQYDSLNRLEQYAVSGPGIVGGTRTVSLQYNAIGAMLYKSDVGAYSYPPSGPTSVRPHAVSTVNGAALTTYGYDANGNLVSADRGRYTSISYTSFNLPNASGGLLGAGGGTRTQWAYDENHARLRETRTISSGVMAGVRTTWFLHPDKAGGLGFESEENAPNAASAANPSTISNRHYLTADGQSIGVLVSNGALPALTATATAPPTLPNIVLTKVEYWHKDHLGSTVATTDHAATVTARMGYDPFGKRRTTAGVYDVAGSLQIDYSPATNNGTDRGFTGHEHLDEFGLVHMNGRLYDPTLGLFLQADPHIQDPKHLLSYNRYSYCLQSPLSCTDSTGELWEWVIGALVAIWGAKAAGWIDIQTARALTAVVVSAALAPGTAIVDLGNPLLQTALAGFAGGAISSGNVKGAMQGAVSSMVFYGIGSGLEGAKGLTDAERLVSGVALHAVAGCVMGAAQGGKCGPSALSAGFSKAITPLTGPLGQSDPFAGALISAVVGGTASMLGGGKFENGAMTGAFSYLFNCLMHECLAQGRDAERTFRGHLNSSGTTASAGLAFDRFYDSQDNFFFGRPDIFSESLRMVWDVKPLSLYGLASGADQISRYTLTGEYAAGTAAPIFGSQTTITLTGSMNKYEYSFGGNGLILYRALDPSPMERALRRAFQDHANRVLTGPLPSRRRQRVPD